VMQHLGVLERADLVIARSGHCLSTRRLPGRYTTSSSAS
jgi:hypothetical protein